MPHLSASSQLMKTRAPPTERCNQRFRRLRYSVFADRHHQPDPLKKMGQTTGTDAILLIHVLNYDEEKGSWFYGKGGKNVCRIQYSLFRSSSGEKIWETLEFRQHEQQALDKSLPDGTGDWRRFRQGRRGASCGAAERRRQTKESSMTSKSLSGLPVPTTESIQPGAPGSRRGFGR